MVGVTHMICPKCGYAAPATDRFCENCGTALSKDAPASNASGLQLCHCPPGQSKPDEDGYCQVCGIRCISETEAARKHVEVPVDERLALVSDVGRRHPINEDTGSVARGSGNSVIMVVADGVSTATNSASASAATVEAVVATLGSLPDDALSEAVRSAIVAANQAALNLPLTSGEEDGPETTVVVALCRGGRVAVGWAGDSRAYLVGPDAAEQLTVDDSWVEEAIHGGEMSRQQAMLDKRAHFVTQVLGMRDQPLDIHIVERELPEDSILLLCSDGLWNYFLEPSELTAALRQQNAGDSLSACRCLVDAANERGGQDNVTVAILHTQPPPSSQSSSPEA